jgi:hypothetical protein
MKLWKVWALFGLGGAGLVAGLLGGGTGCSGGSSSVPSGQPPAPPTTTTPASMKTETFAVKYLFLGEADRSNGGAPGSTPPSNSAWKAYGYNLDGKVTTATSTDVCTLAAGAPKDNQIDGNNGIDNSFGSVILPIIQSAASLPAPSTTITTAIDSGKFTILMEIVGLDDTTTQNSTGLTGQLFAGGAYNGTPAFDMTTDWPVLPQLLKDYNMQTGTGTIASGSTVQFVDSNNNPTPYITNGTFVSGNLATGGITVTISLVFDGVPLSLSINHAVITFDHTAPNTAANGTIAGVINTNDLINGLKAVAGRISTSLCGGAFDGIAQQIMQASDIIHDGTNVMGTACDGISVGLGFTGALIANPDTVSMSDGGVPPDPCTTPMNDGGNPNDSGNNGNDSSTDATGQ